MKYIKSNIPFILFLSFMMAILFVPGFKAVLLKGLTKTGLFQPKIESKGEQIPALSKVEIISSNGEKLDLSDTKGKVIFLNFWATWCPPCIAEMPSIQALKNKTKNKDAVIFAMVDADNDLQNSMAFMKTHQYDLPVYLQSSPIPESIFKGTLPTTIILNKRGEMMLKHEGIADYDTKEMLNLLNKLAE